MAANVTGLPVRIPEGGEAAAMGAAIQALYCCERAAGRVASIEALVDAHVVMSGGGVAEGGVVEPEPAQAARWEAAYAEYMKYLGALTPLYR